MSTTKSFLLGVLAALLFLTASFAPSQIAHGKEVAHLKNDATDSTNVDIAKLMSPDRSKEVAIQNRLEAEGRAFAKKGFYEQALEKYKRLLNLDVFVYEYEKGPSLSAIRDIHERQGKLELALQENKYFSDAFRKSGYWDNPDYVNFPLDKQLELEAMIKARDSGSAQPIHDHINYIRDKYKKFFPPNRLESVSYGWISDIIHLYNYLADADGGIRFMDELIVFMESKPATDGYRHPLAEYKKVKEAFEEDKRTGQKGHLQKVIETSDFISW